MKNKPYLQRTQTEGADLHFYRRDMVVKYRLRGKLQKTGGKKKGTNLKRYSDASMKRLSFVANNTSVQLKNMITLTYPTEWPNDGIVIKSHLNRFLNSLRRKDVNYLWFLEFQKRGAPHFHILIDKYIDKKYVSKRWYKIVGSGDYKHKSAGTRVERLRSRDGGARYATKYATKIEQKTVPSQFQNVGRFWGHSAAVAPVPLDVLNDVSHGVLLDSCGDNQRARQQLALWIVGADGVPPVSVVFGQGVGDTSCNSNKS